MNLESKRTCVEKEKKADCERRVLRDGFPVVQITTMIASDRNNSNKNVELNVTVVNYFLLITTPNTSCQLKKTFILP